MATTSSTTIVDLVLVDNLFELAFMPLWIIGVFLLPIIGFWLFKKFIIH